MQLREQLLQPRRRGKRANLRAGQFVAVNAHILDRDVVQAVVLFAASDAQRKGRADAAFQPVVVPVGVDLGSVDEQFNSFRAASAIVSEEDVLPLGRRSPAL